MINFKTYLFLSLPLLLGCGRPTDYTIAHEYVETFLFEARARNKQVSVEGLTVVFYEENNGYVGWCNWQENKIGLSKPYWEKITPADKEQLVFHELGHCVLKLGHDTIPSIMYPYMIDTSLYTQNRTYYVNRLFNVQ